METLQTRYGMIPVTGFVEYFEDGSVMSCAPAGEFVFDTPYGPLTAQHSTDDLRRRTVQAVSFHPGGGLRALPLERPTVIPTPAGPMSAELVTFHPDGSLSRVFPLNGKLSGYWTQEDEGRLSTPVELDTPLGSISAHLIAARFHPQGALLSLTLWPGEALEVATPFGPMTARVGVSFRPDGSLRSLEPARPQSVPTKAGFIQAYDLDAVGISGDLNSLAFAQDGSVERISTTLSRVVAKGPGDQELAFTPVYRESLCGDGEREPVPMQLAFSPEATRIRTTPDAQWTILPSASWTLRAEPFLRQFANPFGRMSCSC